MSEPEHWEKSGCFTFFIWTLPTVIVPFIAILFGEAFPLGLFFSFFIVLWMGYGWALTSVPPERRISNSDKRKIWFKAVGFTLAQCAIVPVICISALYGFCLIIR